MGSAIITLESADGARHSVELLDIFEFKGQEYGLLLKLEDESLVVMRRACHDGVTTFHLIESDEEFQDVLDHIRAMANAAPGE